MKLLEWADLATLITRSQAQINTCLTRLTHSLPAGSVSVEPTHRRGAEALRNRLGMGRKEWTGSFSSWLPLGNLAWNWLPLEKLLYANVNKLTSCLLLGEFSPQLGPLDEVCQVVSLAPGLGPWPLIAKYLKSSIQGQTLNRAKRRPHVVPRDPEPVYSHSAGLLQVGTAVTGSPEVKEGRVNRCRLRLHPQRCRS